MEKGDQEACVGCQGPRLHSKATDVLGLPGWAVLGALSLLVGWGALQNAEPWFPFQLGQSTPPPTGTLHTVAFVYHLGWGLGLRGGRASQRALGPLGTYLKPCPLLPGEAWGSLLASTI